MKFLKGRFDSGQRGCFRECERERYPMWNLKIDRKEGKEKRAIDLNFENGMEA